MLEIFAGKKAKRTIFGDFAYMDEREVQYIRKLYETTVYYSQYNNMGYSGQRYDVGQLNLSNNSLGGVNQMGNGNRQGGQQNGQNGHVVPGSQMQMTPMMPPGQIGQANGMVQMNPMMTVPPGIMRPSADMPGSNLGFQMNPVSKANKKK
jgi:hypothetical protein